MAQVGPCEIRRRIEALAVDGLDPRSVDAIMGLDDRASSAWSRPMTAADLRKTLVGTVRSLNEVLRFLDSRLYDKPAQ